MYLSKSLFATRLETLWSETWAETFWLETCCPMLPFLGTLWPETFWAETFCQLYMDDIN